MTASDGFAEFLSDQLAPLGRITLRPMFGKTGVFCDSFMLGMVSDNTLYFRVDDDNRTAFKGAESFPPLNYKKKGSTIDLSFWRAPERLFDEPDELVTWARAALAAARRVAAKREPTAQKRFRRSSGGLQKQSRQHRLKRGSDLWKDAMDCCGHGHVAAPQPWVWSTPPVSVGAMLAGGAGPRGSTAAAQTAETTAAALAVLRNSISVDVHSHGGSTGITSKAPPSGDLAGAMRAGSLAVACVANVPDWPVLARSAEGGLAAIREPAPGELYRYHLDRLAWMDELVADHRVRRALNAADLEAAHKAREPAIIADVEGLDFLDGKLERLEEAHRRGIRHVQLVHYTPNDIGDFQTGAITHQGLTEFGAEVIRACDRLGFVCDVAHATEDMAKQAVEVATKPLLLSHTAVLGSRAMGPTPLGGRQVNPGYARAIAETGGSVGIWHFFPSIDRYVDGLKEMAEIVGVDHVSIGTDQFDARGCVEDYTRWVQLLAAMLRGGFTPEEVGKIAGGNYLRIFRAAVG